MPELNYLSNNEPNPQGEIFLWGPSIMKGYFNNPELTTQTIVEDGWLSTGDIGEVQKNGAIKILGRLDSLIKFS